MLTSCLYWRCTQVLTIGKISAAVVLAGAAYQDEAGYARMTGLPLDKTRLVDDKGRTDTQVRARAQPSVFRVQGFAALRSPPLLALSGWGGCGGKLQALEVCTCRGDCACLTASDAWRAWHATPQVVLCPAPCSCAVYWCTVVDGQVYYKSRRR